MKKAELREALIEWLFMAFMGICLLTALIGIVIVIVMMITGVFQ